MHGALVKQRQLTDALTLAQGDPAVSQLHGGGAFLDDEQPRSRLVGLNQDMAGRDLELRGNIEDALDR
jgi:hypothetical protein